MNNWRRCCSVTLWWHCKGYSFKFLLWNYVCFLRCVSVYVCLYCQVVCARCPMPPVHILQPNKRDKYSCFAVIGDSAWCSDKYSVWCVCTKSSIVIISFPWHIKFTLCYCKEDLTHILAQRGVSLESFPLKELIGSHSCYSGLLGVESYPCVCVSNLHFNGLTVFWVICL